MKRQHVKRVTGVRTPGARAVRRFARLRGVSNLAKKNALRAGTVSAGTVLMMLMSTPAFAAYRDDGDDPGPGLSVAETLGLFVITPIASFLLIAALVVVGEKAAKKKYG